MSAPRPAPARRGIGLPELWFGLFGAGLAWSLQELVSFSLVAHSCYPQRQPRTLPLISGTWTISLVIGLVMLLLGAAAAFTAWRAWRRTEPPEREPLEHLLEVGEGHSRFMAFSGLLVSGFLLYAIVLNLIVLFLVAPCG